MVTNENPPANPYGGVPGGGITLPPYYKPTPSMKSATTYFPTAEELGADEMRISFVGSCPFPPRADQAATCIMVELGTGKRFFFDFGPGCLRNIIAMQVPLQMINDIFITHLHVDHFGELPYLYCFAPWAARWKPLRVTGRSGRTPEDGTSYMLEQMQKMLHWHTDSFNSSPIGDGYEVDVTEFDYRDDNRICYDQDGVTIRHWRRSHTKDGASAPALPGLPRFQPPLARLSGRPDQASSASNCKLPGHRPYSLSRCSGSYIFGLTWAFAGSRLRRQDGPPL